MRLIPRVVAPLLLSLVLVGAPQLLAAQTGPLIQISYAKQLKATGIGLGYGLNLGESLSNANVWGQVTAEYFFVDKFKSINPVVEELSHSYYEFNLNALKVTGGIPGLYLGTGINYSTEKIDAGNYRGDEGGANLGVSAIGGFHFGPLKQAPFVQARYEFGGGKQFIVSLGLAF